MEATVDVLPFHNKDLIPKDRLDRGLFVVMTVIIPFVAVWEIAIVLRYHQTFDCIFYLHVFLITFILVNIIGNLYYLKRIDASGKQKKLPSVLRPGWQYCHFCELNSPPRSRHCPVCNECILKRDQHCMFAGCCIGFYNHRYYVLSVLYAWIGAMYAFFYQWDYCFETMGGLHLTTPLYLAAPHVAFLFGFLSLYGFIIVTVQIFLFIAILMTTYLWTKQFICIYHGQTLHERKEGIRLYDLGWKQNFIQVLGRKWYLVFIVPFIPSALPGDGLQFSTYNDFEEIKNI